MPAHDHPLLGKWRIVEMALWDADFLDLVEPAYIAFDRQGRGEFVFGAVYGSLDCRYGRDGVAFTWQGSDEMDPACGDGDAELDEDGSLVGEIRFHGGDEFRLQGTPLVTLPRPAERIGDPLPWTREATRAISPT